MTADNLMRAAVESDEAFIREFTRILKDELHMTVTEFSEKSGIPASTMYKILSGHREPNIKTLRQIVTVLRELEAKEKQDGNVNSGVIAVIAARPVLDIITEKKLKVKDRLLTIREYSAVSMEDAIIAAIKAERDGAKAVVCAPIVSTTIEKVLQIPESPSCPGAVFLRLSSLLPEK